MLMDKIKLNVKKLTEEKKKKEDKIPFDFKESFVATISGDKNGSIQNI